MAAAELISTRARQSLQRRYGHRFTFASPALRRAWLPRIDDFLVAWHTLEVLTVSAGVRRMALITCLIEEIPHIRAYCKARGLRLFTDQRQHVGDWTCAGVFPWAENPQTARRDFRYARRRRLGELLGYPDCCIEGFRQTMEENCDPTWRAARLALSDGHEEPSADAHDLTLECDPRLNVCLLAGGIRLLAHMPHSLACEASLQLSSEFMQVARTEGYDREIDTALEMLSWPVVWSDFRGLLHVHTAYMSIASNGFKSEGLKRLRVVPRDRAPAGPTERASDE